MKEIEAHYSLEWEERAFEEIKQKIRQKWEKEEEHFCGLHTLNDSIVAELTRNEIKLDYSAFITGYSRESENLLELINRVYCDLIYMEPVLRIVNINNLIPPKEMTARDWVRNECLKDFRSIFLFYDGILNSDILIDSELAKSTTVGGRPIKGLPASCFVAGRILGNLFLDFDHYRLIDLIATPGDSIEDLRKKRIYQSEEGIVYDYSPLTKFIKSESKMIQEVFTKDDFDSIGNDNTLWQVDEILCSILKRTQCDGRQNEFFGNDLKKAKNEFIIRYQGQDKKIAFQLLPKYFPAITKNIKRYKLSNLGVCDSEKKLNFFERKADEIQEAILGLRQASITWEKTKGTVASHLNNGIVRSLSDAFKKQSTTCYKESRKTREPIELETEKFFNKRILKDELESSCGIDSCDLTLKEQSDFVESEYSMDPAKKIESQIEFQGKQKEIEILQKALSSSPEMRKILKKEEKGVALTPTERQRKKRFIEKMKNK